MICAAESTERSPSGTRKKVKGDTSTLPGYPNVSSSRPLDGSSGEAEGVPCVATRRNGACRLPGALVQFSGTAGASSTFPPRRSTLAQVPLIQMQLSSQSIDESCESYPDLRIHALIPVLARPHARGASCGDLQLEACRGSRSSSSNSSPLGSERSCRFSAVCMHR